MHTTTTLVYGGCGLLLYFLLNQIVQIVYYTFISSLRNVPGPWISSITALPTQMAIMSKRQVHFYHDLHQKYGPFVRVGPTEIIVSDLAAFKEIHRIGTHFYKSDFYKVLNPTEPGTGPYTLFSETDVAEHAKRRKLIGRGFTQSFLRSNWEPFVLAKVEDAVRRLKAESAKNGDVDILKWYLFMAADVVSELMFGESFDLLKQGQKTAWFHAMEKGTQASVMYYFFPWLYRALRLIPLPAVQSFFDKRALVEQGQTAVKNSRSAASAKNIFANVLEQAEKEDATMTDTQIVVEASSFIIAGTDTTANTLTYLIYSALSNPPLLEALQKELAGVDQPYLDSKLEALPILSAVIKETLRLYGAAPGALPRVVPPEGATLGEYHLPAGTIVSTQAWTLHRDPTIFPNPEQFDYTRWLPSAPLSEEAKVAFHPFGAGSRVCTGMNLAYMELRLAAATFFRECRGAKPAPETTPESMEVENIFLIRPKAGECKIVVPDS